ncbi:MAG TPA: tryptophan synthase subunit alpha [Chthoniobacterales bacterium]|jgi:tryptophan synthase alpha chain
MQNRIDEQFEALRRNGRAGFAAYITGGDPNLERTIDIAVGLAETGVDFLELGVPFSDPLADGIANQLGAQRALASGTTLPKLLYTISQIRCRIPIPIILYSYLNPIYQYGFEQFEQDALAVGIDGLLLLDLPPDEHSLSDRSSFLHRIRLIAPTTSEERIRTIAARASGFIYYVSREGVTGEQRTLSDSIGAQVEKIRRYSALPIAVGFGISNAEQAAQVAALADAVVVGSAIVRRIGELANESDIVSRLRELVHPMVEAVKSIKKSSR